MSGTVSKEFVYESGCIDGISRSLWNTLDEQTDTEARTEFEGDQFTLAINSTEEGMYGTLRAPEPGDNPNAPPVPHLEVVDTLDVLRQVDDPSAHVEGIIAGAATIYESLSPRPDYVYGLDAVHEERLWEGDLPLPVTPDGLASDRIQDVSWMMIFPPAMVESYGRQFLLDAPAWRTSELDDGSVCIISFENPAAFEGHDELERMREYFEL